MGNVVSGGEHNEDLVNILKVLGYIQTKKIEYAFRAVDRGDYVLAAHRKAAYKDLAWRIGNIHLSAPCVYGKVMEGLSLKSGLSFLNIGSGTGYLSSMAGLILNHRGTNHGIELNEDCLEYAYEKLKEFKEKSLAIDVYDFCEPVFIHGNCLKLEPNRQYDRVYCGAACPESHEAFIKQFVKIGGILVMPYKENLLRIERVDKNIWLHTAILPVSFAPLILPNSDDQHSLQLPRSQPLSLQELSRCIIRCEIRKLLWETHPELQTCDLIINDADKTTPIRRLALPHIFPYDDSFNTISSSEDDNDTTSCTAQIFLYGDIDLPDEELVVKTQVIKNNVPSRINNCSSDVSDNSDGESLKNKNNDEINETKSITDTNSPSTSYQNNISVNKINDNDNLSPLTKEIVNTKVNSDQSSTINSVEKTNKCCQCNSDIDDDMDLDTPSKQLENNENQNEIMKNNDNEDHSINLSDRDASMGDSSSGDDNGDYNDDEDDEDEDETDSLMDWKTNEMNDQDKSYVPKSRQFYAHNVQMTIFSTYMKDKISKLPLPTSLLLYMNHNRTF